MWIDVIFINVRSGSSWFDSAGSSSSRYLKQAAANPNIKPISGSWFEFQHPGGKEGVYWDKDLRQFTAAQWREKFVKSVRPVWNIW